MEFDVADKGVVLCMLNIFRLSNATGFIIFAAIPLPSHGESLD